MKFGDVISKIETENLVQTFEDIKVSKIKSRINLLEEALKYTKKSMLIKKHNKELLFLKTELNLTDFANKTMDYLSKLSMFAKHQA